MVSNNDQYPLVSIAVATYNGQIHLQEQLNSLLAQDYPSLEIVISDDGSTDDTILIIEKYQSANRQVKLFHNNTGQGIKKNFENALSFCNGEFIALCDQDDYWLPGKITWMVNTIGNHALAYHDSLFTNDKGESLQKTISQKMHCYSGNDPRAFFLHNCISGHAALFRKTLLKKALPFPGARYHDWWLAFIATGAGGVIFTPEVLVNYRQHSTSKTDILKRKKDYKHSKEFVKYQEELEWYTQCAMVEGPHQAFCAKWLSHYQRRLHQWFSPWLFSTGLKHMAILYRIPKKSPAGKFLLALKLLWGIRLKKWIS